MFGGRNPVPLVLRTKVAMGSGYGSQHLMDPAGIFATAPGWRIMAASTPFDYVGLMNAALAVDDPVLMLEHVDLYGAEGEIPVDDLDYQIPFGTAAVRRAGSRGHRAHLPVDGGALGRGDRADRDRRRAHRPALPRPGLARLGDGRRVGQEDQRGADRRAGRPRHLLRRLAGGRDPAPLLRLARPAGAAGAPAASRRRRSPGCSSGPRSRRPRKWSPGWNGCAPDSAAALERGSQGPGQFRRQSCGSSQKSPQRPRSASGGAAADGDRRADALACWPARPRRRSRTGSSRPATAVAVGTPLAEIETEKALVEYAAEEAGIIGRLVLGEGDTGEIGDPIAVLVAAGETDADIDAALGGTAAQRRRPAPSGHVRRPGASVGTAGAAVGSDRQRAPGARDHGGRIFASPLVRKLAGERGIDLAGLAGTGPNGRIVRRDLERFLAAAPASRRQPPAPTRRGTAGGETEPARRSG